MGKALRTPPQGRRWDIVIWTIVGVLLIIVLLAWLL